MPVSFPSPSRRRFLARVASGAATVWLGTRPAAAADPNRWALLADTHVAADPATVVRGANMAANLERVIRQVLDAKAGHNGLLINGDCALTDGKPEDYAALVKLLGPAGAAGLSVHLTLGNHDHRANFRQARVGAGAAAVESKHLTVIEGPLACWYLLDSLNKTNVTPGLLGEEQLRWLGEAMDARPQKAALVMVHHNPLFLQPGSRGGLLDTDQLLQVLAPRRQAKALLYGHVHHWDVRRHERLHVVGLPPVAYVFQAGDPSGWVDLTLDASGARLELRSLDPAHREHGRVVRLDWS